MSRKPIKRSQMNRYAAMNLRRYTDGEAAAEKALYQARAYIRKSHGLDIGEILTQHVIQSRSKKHSYIFDFYLPRITLAIEIDGECHRHRGEYDKHRDEYAQDSRDIKTIRYSNDEAMNPNFRDAVRKAILDRLCEKPRKGLEYDPEAETKRREFMELSYRKERHLRS